MATQDYGTCPDCGNPLSEEDARADFNRRADLIMEALDGADPVTIEVLLSMFAGRYIAEYVPEDQKKAKRGLVREIGIQTREHVIRSCDA
jgi:hypothetical protein